METDLKLDTRLIRKLREDRGWSQEHLASVAGLSARTVQRLENEGSASLESRSALATAFGVAASALNEARPAPSSDVASLSTAAFFDRLAAEPFKVVQWTVIIAMFLAAMGYAIGKDLAKRDDRLAEAAKCAAAPAGCASATKRAP